MPMYMRAETRTAHFAFWQVMQKSFRDHGLPAPDLTDDPGLPEHWMSTDLLFSQTCGRPYATKLRDYVSLVATPDYGLAGCPAGHYRSAIIVRADDPRTVISAFTGAILAFNEIGSQSGYAAAKEFGLRFRSAVETGAHLNSCTAVASGKADIATIDAVTWALAERYDELADLRVLGWTKPNPGLPFVTAKQNDVVPIRRATQQALSALPKDVKTTLMIQDLVQIPSEAYLKMVEERPE